MKPATKQRRVRVGVDTGGTFTDFIYHDGITWQLFKLPSTPDDPAHAIAAGLSQIATANGVQVADLEVVHGTTVGTNATLERRGARIALITTAGFEDVLVIGRQARPALYNLHVTRPAPLVADNLRLGVHERLSATGAVLQPLSDNDLAALVTKLRDVAPENKPAAIAICLLFGFVNPAHEQRLADALRVLDVPLSVAHEILPAYREYERTATVCLNAYLQPLMGKYLRRLQQVAPALRVMQSAGGSISAERAATEPVRTILSGPAGGSIGARLAAQASNFNRIITFDMGGTSTDVALCDAGGLTVTREAIVAGLPVAVPMLDIHTVGAGGGSLAYVDAGGSLRVGPQSAGAEPGPACYGRGGTKATVTDAHCVLNHFGDNTLLDGAWQLDATRAASALEDLGGEMSAAVGREINHITAALGVLEVVRVNMERALRVISVERGHDPRDFALLPFGGAGGLHAVALAQALRMQQVIVPFAPGALSALGCVASDVVKDTTQTLMQTADVAAPHLAAHFRALASKARALLRREGFTQKQQRHEFYLEARYRGQSFSLELLWTPRLNVVTAFHAAHKARYGYTQEAQTVEIVSLRVRSRGLTDAPPFAVKQDTPQKTRRVAPKSYAPVYWTANPTHTAIYARAELPHGALLQTPCIVREYSATTLIPIGTRAAVDAVGNLVIAL